MSTKIKAKISKDGPGVPSYRYRYYVGAEGYNSNNDFVMSDDIRDWAEGKYRRSTSKSNPPLF